MTLVFFAIWVGLAFVAAGLARSKGRSGFGYFVLSCAFSFLIAALVLAIVPSKEKKNFDPVPRTTCPYCREQIIADAIVCKHCGRDVEPDLEIISKAHDAQFAQKTKLSGLGKLAIGMIIVGFYGLYSWVDALKSWTSADKSGWPLVGRIIAITIEIGLVASGIVVSSREQKKRNK